MTSLEHPGARVVDHEADNCALRDSAIATDCS